MTKSSAVTKSAPAPLGQKDDFSTRLVIFKDIAEVTWRMFVPSVGGAVLGVIGDRVFHTTPWLTVAGVTLGFAIVVFLVYRQVQATAVDKKSAEPHSN